MRISFVLLTLLGIFFTPVILAQRIGQDTVPQKDIIDVVSKLFKADKFLSTRADKKVNFSILPVAAAATGTGRVAVSSFNAAFYLGSKKTTNLSTINFVPYTNFSSRSGFTISPNIWLPNNLWNFIGDLRIQTNDHKTYGLGANTDTDLPDTVNFQYARLYLTALHKIKRYFSLGMGYNLDYYYNVDEKWSQPHPSPFSAYGIGIGPQTTSTGITFNALIDSRMNSINPEGGRYSYLVFRDNPAFLANDYRWTSLYFDNRKYISLSPRRHSVLALWALYWGTYGDVPYLNLPGTSLDPGGRMGRGYSLGRFRGKQLLYGETEYRFDISGNGFWGGALFANLQSYTEPITGRFQYVQPAAGFGLRVKFNKHSATNLTLDFAWGKDSFNWYINLGEFF